VLFIDHVPIQTDQRYVVLKVGGIVVGVHLLPLNAILLVVQPLLLATHIPFAQANLHVGVGGAEREISISYTQTYTARCLKVCNNIY